MQALRASRISEVEWDARRQKLEGLYLDDNLSRQEVVEIMAREDSFFATEKQLKYQFNKWGLKKNISNRDLTAMLSVKRKRQELGKNTGFVCRGHVVEQERLERAFKRRKGPLMSSPDLPPYIRTLVSPQQSPQITSFLSPHPQTSAVPDGIEEATHDSGRPSSLDLLSNNSFHQSGDSGMNDAFNSLDVFPDPMLFYGGQQNQANGELWGTLLDNSIVSFSPGRQSFMPTPSGRDIQPTPTGNPSPLTRQITSIPPAVPAEQSAHDNGFPLFDSNIDLDFSIFLKSPRRTSTAPSSSHTDLDFRRSVERRSISPLQLTDHDDTHRENRGFNLISKTTSAAARALDPVTVEDVTAESIASLLLSLRSLVFPRFDTASQRYEYETSILSDLFCPHWCEWLCFEFEELLDLYLEKSLRSIRKRRTARIQSSLPSGCNYNLNECRSFESWNGSQQLSKPTKATVVTKMRSTFYHHRSLPTGFVMFEVRGGFISPTGEEGNDSNRLVIISYIPRATERTPGLCVQFSRMMGGPAITPQINTFNFVPDDSAIIQCVRENDLGGVQTLFDLGAASARDVDSRGISLLYYAMFTGCSDVFRLLIQGGASTNACKGYAGPGTDIVTVIWDSYVDANQGAFCVGFSMEKLKEFEQCVAMTQLAIDNDCTIDSARDDVLGAGPLFSLTSINMYDAYASASVDAIDYLSSIGWDLEEKNCLGQTPLLYAAVACEPQVARCLRALIKRGARLDARDEIGRGPLLSALSPPQQLCNWVDLTYAWDLDGADNSWMLSQIFGTEDRRLVQDYYDAERILDPLTTPAEQLLPTGLSMSDLDSDASPCAEQSILEPEDDDYVYCVDEMGNSHWIRNPSHLLKARVKTKLKILLEAGCDPNDRDEYGESTNDYARRGLWSQWLWALEKTGYVFDEEQNRWIKRIDTA